MSDERGERIVAALKAEARSASLTLTEADVLERIARPTEPRWGRLFGVGLAALAFVALVTVAVVPQVRLGDQRVEPIQPEPIQLEPSVALPPPYDWTGVRDALAPRGLSIDIPTPAQRADAVLDVDRTLGVVRAEYQSEPGISIISLHLATVTSADERLPLSGELMYIAESTGHQTGNCFTLIGVADSEPVIGACFYAERSQPYAALPIGNYQADMPVGKTCLALTFARREDWLLTPRAADVSARWWDVGASGDCTTTTSSVVVSSVEIVSATSLEIGIPLMSGEQQQIVVEIVTQHDGGFTALAITGDERVELRFNFVEEIDPAFVPIGG